ncbi:hypothetical protein BGZ70_008738, partial [Mortierella alpina]
MDCRCKDSTSACGSSFSAKCGLDPASLYDCSESGSDPLLASKCETGLCLIEEGADACQPPKPTTCQCKDSLDVCGKVYNETCQLDPDTLYTCAGIGSDPAPGPKCDQGCLMHSGDTADECIKDSCLCTESGRICGSAMPSNCSFTFNAIYDCTGGRGSRPVLQKLCLPGSTCLGHTDGPSCGGETCDCKGDQTVCSDQFLDSCGLQKNTVYQCAPSGKPVLLQTCGVNKECVSVSDGATCASKDCKCPADGTLCGEIFPLSCQLNATSLYTCAKGGDPVFEKTCLPGHCIASAASMAAVAVFDVSVADQCLRNCVCSNTGFMCGATFPPECNKGKDVLYVCYQVGSIPIESERCTDGVCSVNPGDDNCGTIASTPNCYCNDTITICGSKIDPSCSTLLKADIDPKATYICIVKTDEPASLRANAGDMCIDLCACKAANTSSAFAETAAPIADRLQPHLATCKAIRCTAARKERFPTKVRIVYQAFAQVTNALTNVLARLQANR